MFPLLRLLCELYIYIYICISLVVVLLQSIVTTCRNNTHLTDILNASLSLASRYFYLEQHYQCNLQSGQL